MRTILIFLLSQSLYAQDLNIRVVAVLDKGSKAEILVEACGNLVKFRVPNRNLRKDADWIVDSIIDKAEKYCN